MQDGAVTNTHPERHKWHLPWKKKFLGKREKKYNENTNQQAEKCDAMKDVQDTMKDEDFRHNPKNNLFAQVCHKLTPVKFIQMFCILW